MLDYGAELVVLATGSSWLDGDGEWADLPFAQLRAAGVPMYTPEQIVRDGQRPSGKRVTIWDRDGTTVGASLAERLVADGYEVTIASAFERVAPMLDATFEGYGERKRLHDLGVDMRISLSLAGAKAGTVLFRDEFDEDVAIETDSLVLVVQRRADDALYH